MILALEGPDKCGKTSLFNMLKGEFPGARFVPSRTLQRPLFLVAQDVQVREADLWAALYDRSQLYVCDRHFSVSGRVYDAFYERGEPKFDWRAWAPELLVVGFNVTAEELRLRCEKEGDEYCEPGHYGRLMGLYAGVLLDYDRMFVEGTIEQEVERVKWAVEARRPGSARRGASRGGEGTVRGVPGGVG